MTVAKNLETPGDDRFDSYYTLLGFRKEMRSECSIDHVSK